MKTYAVALLLIVSSIDLNAQHNEVVNYPIKLLFKGNVLKCLQSYGENLDRLIKFENTFIATIEFIERFEKSGCDPVVFEYYTKGNLKLYKVDSLVVNYYDSLSRTPPIYETENGKIISSSKDIAIFLREKFIEYSRENKGYLRPIDYSKIDLNSKSSTEKLKSQGLNDLQIKLLYKLMQK